MKKPKPLKSLGNYMPKVLASLTGEKTGAFDAIIAHDDWCNLLKGKGVYNCNPTIEAMTHEEYMKRTKK